MMKIVYFSLRNPDAQRLFCANFTAHGTDNFQRNGQPVFQGTAPSINTLVGIVCQELVKQVPVRRMDLNAVKCCITDGELRAVGKAGDDVADLLFTECPGSAVFPEP